MLVVFLLLLSSFISSSISLSPSSSFYPHPLPHIFSFFSPSFFSAFIIHLIGFFSPPHLLFPRLCPPTLPFPLSSSISLPPLLPSRLSLFSSSYSSLLPSYHPYLPRLSLPSPLLIFLLFLICCSSFYPFPRLHPPSTVPIPSY